MKIADRFRKSRFFRKNRAGAGNGKRAGHTDKSGRKRGNDSDRSNRSGIALLTVLTVMALTTIMVMTFFSLAMSENRASTTYSHGLQAQYVAEEAVNMVIAQIRAATTVGQAGAPIAWASQPGMIRTWRGRNFDGGYKLYSDDQMLLTSQANVDTDFNDLQAGWSARVDQFVDLNEPVIRGQKVYYPIVNPSASTIPDWPRAIGRDQNGVEGFRYNWDGGHSVTDPGLMGRRGAERLGVGHVPMPVRWIYQLADGTMGTLDDSNQFRAMDGGTTVPSELNRIVARFAFWADDETSKLNLNTAAGGLAWDIPRAGGQMDMDMAKFQPAQHEWQRYPGHPATTHLIPALAPGVLDIVNDRDAMEMLFRVVPRIVGGGSQSGTRILNTRDPAEENGLVADKDPLFPSVDDMIMRPDRTPNLFPDGNGGALAPDQLSEYMERSKFFVTVSSRAPETNLFNMPRVAIWPIYDADYGTEAYNNQNNQGYLTEFDRLIHYCASMGDSGSASGYPRFDYIFKRKNADSVHDDYDGISRNQDVYKYLLRLMRSPTPGYGASFAGKYPQDNQQILTEIFDYIRTTNLHDDSLFIDYNEAYTVLNTPTHRTYTNPRRSSNRGTTHKGHGQVVPIRIAQGGAMSGNTISPSDTKGFGRFYTIGGAAVQVICCADGSLEGSVRRGNSGTTGRTNRAPFGAAYMNFPPMPVGININDDTQVRNLWWPAWLIQMRENNLAQLQLAFNPENWNWQLAFMDPVYVFNTVSGRGPGASMAQVDFFDNLGNPISNNPGGGSEGPHTPRFHRAHLSREAFADGITRLKPDEKLVQAILLFNLFTPSVGWTAINPDMEIEVNIESGMGFASYIRPLVEISGDLLAGNVGRSAYAVPGQLLGTPTYPTGAGFAPEKPTETLFLPLDQRYHAYSLSNQGIWTWSTNWTDGSWGMARYGGILPFDYVLTTRSSRLYRDYRGISRAARLGVVGFRGRLTPLDGHYFRTNNDNFPPQRNLPSGDLTTLNDIVEELNPGYSPAVAEEAANSYRYDLVTIPFVVKGASAGLGENGPGPAVSMGGGNVEFRLFHGGRAAEGSEPQQGRAYAGVQNSDRELVQEIKMRFDQFTVPAPISIHGNSAFYNEFNQLARQSFGALEMASVTADPANQSATNNTKTEVNVIGAIPARGRMSQLNMNHRVGLFSTQASGTVRTATGLEDKETGDVVQALGIQHGDARLIAGQSRIGLNGNPFERHEKYGDERMAHAVGNSYGGAYIGYEARSSEQIRPNINYGGRRPLPFYRGNSNSIQVTGDFDNGAGLMIDGPYINKPDEGNVNSLRGRYDEAITDQWELLRDYGEFPYFVRQWRHESGGPAYFSPNRLVSGPGVFGSLSTGVNEGVPWRTLLFRPSLLASGAGFAPHYGAGSRQGGKSVPGGQDPPDHVIMDLFWMPVVEPYAISEPLSTAGKINMNYAMQPFKHIERTTALRGVLKSEFMMCVPNRWERDYKSNMGRGRGYHWRDSPYGGQLQGKRLRSVIVEDDTLDQFRDGYFDQGEIFKTASQICEIYLIGEDVADRLGLPARVKIGTYKPTLGQMESGEYWRAHALVGENSKERPYANIHQRLTTKSNTFKVHYRAQVLRQSRRIAGGSYATWNPELDTVQAEYRGSSIVERYVDPDDPNVEDYATNPNAPPLDLFYKFRVLNPTRFAP